MRKSKAVQMHNVGLVVDDVEAAVVFFLELGLELEGETTVHGVDVDRLLALEGVRSRIAMLRTPDGQKRLELCHLQSPAATRNDPKTPANTLGIRRLMFNVGNLREVLARLQARGAELVGEIVQYEEAYLLCYLRGPEGILIALAESLD